MHEPTDLTSKQQWAIIAAAQKMQTDEDWFSESDVQKRLASDTFGDKVRGLNQRDEAQALRKDIRDFFATVLKLSGWAQIDSDNGGLLRLTEAGMMITEADWANQHDIPNLPDKKAQFIPEDASKTSNLPSKTPAEGDLSSDHSSQRPQGNNSSDEISNVEAVLQSTRKEAPSKATGDTPIKETNPIKTDKKSRKGKDSDASSVSSKVDITLEKLHQVDMSKDTTTDAPILPSSAQPTADAINSAEPRAIGTAKRELKAPSVPQGFNIGGRTTTPKEQSENIPRSGIRPPGKLNISSVNSTTVSESEPNPETPQSSTSTELPLRKSEPPRPREFIPVSRTSSASNGGEQKRPDPLIRKPVQHETTNSLLPPRRPTFGKNSPPASPAKPLNPPGRPVIPPRPNAENDTQSTGRIPPRPGSGNGSGRRTGPKPIKPDHKSRPSEPAAVNAVEIVTNDGNTVRISQQVFDVLAEQLGSAAAALDYIRKTSLPLSDSDTE